MLRDTPVIPYTRPPVSTDSAIKKTDHEIAAIYGNLLFPPYSTTFHQILPSSARTTTRSLFCPVHVLIKQPSQRYIPFSPYYLAFSPYATSWPHYTVYVHSLIISTSLYIITAYARSVIGEELEAASWLIKAWSVIEPVELYNKE